MAFALEEVVPWGRSFDEYIKMFALSGDDPASSNCTLAIGSVEELGRVRTTAMRDFLTDYPTGKHEGRYINAELPKLPFSDGAFDLALCSHFLFLYSEHFDKAFHLLSLRELCRVARELRVFPILELGSIRSRHVDEVVSTLTSEGYEVRVERVAYEFKEGGNEMLRLRHRISA